MFPGGKGSLTRQTYEENTRVLSSWLTYVKKNSPFGNYQILQLFMLNRGKSAVEY